MRRIFRETVPADDQPHAFVLRGPILHVATRQEDAVEFWHLHDDELRPTEHTFTVVGTGHPLAAEITRCVGSAITPSGRFVWHLMERNAVR